MKNIVELMIIVAIIGLLAAIAIPSIGEANKKQAILDSDVVVTQEFIDLQREKYTVVKIGNCQYLRNDGAPCDLSHKSDCDNPIHVYNNKEVEKP